MNAWILKMWISETKCIEILLWIFKRLVSDFVFLFVFNKLFQKDEVYLNLVLDYVPETVYRVARHYSRAKQTLPVIYVKVCKSGAISHFKKYVIWAKECAECVLTVLLHIMPGSEGSCEVGIARASLNSCIILKYETFTF